ncbi:hypothetical protein V5N11_025694 [Cardamine amara subsp. amara]|uniref:Reverse transcriptase zinc-binding domain-containing protein n=1 Tax=Cardamine amara subsp. amara TaxID=228776 RepID=A0ABD1BPJ6_CARAN
MAELRPSLNDQKDKIWDIPTVTKVKAFLWRASSEALPVVDLLKIRGMKGDSRCQICGEEGESINHVLFTCTVARQIWALSRFPSPMGGFDAFSVYSNLSYLFNMGKSRILPQQIKRLFPWILWRIWKNRNFFPFEARAFHPLETQQKIEDDAKKLSMAQIVDNERE